MNAQKLFTILEGHCDDVRRYRGRCMSGECPAFVCEDSKVIGIVARIMTMEPDHHEELLSAFERARTDAMGREIVVYFPMCVFGTPLAP